MKLLSPVFAIHSFCIAGKRLTPCQAAMHPFLAPEFPCTYLLPWQGDKISGIVFVGTVFLHFIPRRQQGGRGGGILAKSKIGPCSEFANLM